MELHFNTWLVYFYFYCICGWIFESVCVSVKERKWTNRGFMKGPWLPLYGSGAVIILLVTMPFEKYPVAVYFAGAIAATVLEYVTGVVMLKLFKVRYWDYRYRKIQFQGHICLVSTIAWGFLSLLMVYVVHKPVAAFIARWNPEVLSVITFAVTICIVYDFANAFRDAMDLRALLSKAEELAKELNAAIEEEKKEIARKAAEKRDQFEASLNEKKEQLEISVTETKEKIEQYTETKKEEVGAVVAKTKEQLAQYTEEKRKNRENHTEGQRGKFEKAVEEYQEIREQNKMERMENIQKRIASIEEAKAQLRERIEERAGHHLLRNSSFSFKGFEEESKKMRKRLMERRKSNGH